MCSSIFGVNDVNALYAVVCGSSAGGRPCPDVAPGAGANPADDGEQRWPQSRREFASVAARRCSFPHCAVDVPRSGLSALMSFISYVVGA
jgi:hypothetical protein